MPVNILMPALSPTMEEGTLAKWLVKEGDTVESGDVIAEIETDKATMEVEAVDEGTIGKIVVGDGTENVAVNSIIAVLLEEGEDATSIGDVTAAPAPAPVAATPPKSEMQQKATVADVASTPAPVAPQAADGHRIKASPLARRLASQAGLDLTQVSGSGPHGRIVKRDIEAAQAAGTGKAAPKADAAKAPKAETSPQALTSPSDLEKLGIPAGSYDEIPLDGMRKTVARRLTESKQNVPHFYLTIDCELDKLLALRKELNSRSEEYKISVNDFIIRASALALKKVPEANSSWTDSAILQHHHADIAVAVAIDGGLITPIIREAENKGLAGIANEMKDMAGRARDRKLLPHEFQGGTFSISNLGMFGIKEFSAVINPPHGAILAIGAGEVRPVIKDDKLEKATVMTCTLSCDHRVVDGAVGARFLSAFKGFIEDPVTMML